MVKSEAPAEESPGGPRLLVEGAERCPVLLDVRSAWLPAPCLRGAPGGLPCGGGGMAGRDKRGREAGSKGRASVGAGKCH